MAKSKLWRFSALFAGASLLLAACGSSTDATDTDEPNGTSDETGEVTESVEIGITQIAEHPSLDAARDGFKDALLDAGSPAARVGFDDQNARGERPTAR